MIKVLVPLVALFTTLQAKDINKILEELLDVNDDMDLLLFNGTNAQGGQRTFTPDPQPRRPTSDSSEGKYRLNNTQCGDEPHQESKSFCTQVDNYPDLSALKQKLDGKFARFFNDELIQATNVSARGAPATDEISLCRVNRRILYPRKGRRPDNSWQLIVNNHEYKQGIQIEECESANQPCSYAENFPQQYWAVCRQHYVLQSLVGIPHGGRVDVAQEIFKIPSCCECVLVRR